MGGTEDAATGILGEMSKPLSWGMPSEKVCEKLKKKDRQICELRYGKFLFMLCIVAIGSHNANYVFIRPAWSSLFTSPIFDLFKVPCVI